MTKLYPEIDNSVTNILFIDFLLTLTIIFIYKHQLSLVIRVIYVIYLKTKKINNSLLIVKNIERDKEVEIDS